jgi:hypothetical protein
MANNQKLVKGSNEALHRMKFEVAQEVGVPLKHGYNGDLRASEAGRIGGEMVRKMIAYAEQNLQ